MIQEEHLKAVKEYEKEIKDLRKTIEELKTQIEDYKQGQAPPAEKPEVQDEKQTTVAENGKQYMSALLIRIMRSILKYFVDLKSVESQPQLQTDISIPAPPPLPSASSVPKPPPAPPPPPLSGTLGSFSKLQSLAPTKPRVVPRVKMRPLFWTRILLPQEADDGVASL